MTQQRSLILILLLLFASLHTIGQEEQLTHEAHRIQHHRIALFTGYGLIQGAVDVNGDKKPKVIP